MTIAAENQIPMSTREEQPTNRETNPVGDERWIRHAYNRGAASVSIRLYYDSANERYAAGIAELEACDDLRTDKLHADLRQLCTEVPAEHLAVAVLALLAAERRLER
jgi:hypothetical protein